MTFDTWLAFVVATLVLMSTPGPSQLLMMSNSMANGFRRSLATAAGDLSANVLQMLAAGIGLGAVVLASEHVLTPIKWLGAGYLVWIGIARIRHAGAGATRAARRVSTRALWLQGFVTSATNPKAVVFFAALFPQFIRADGSFWTQFAILGATYVALDGTFLALYGSGAGWLARRLGTATRVWLDRVAGGFLIATGVLLGLRSASR